MATVGSLTCTFLRGHLPSNRQRVRIWEVPGISGYGAKRLGYGGSEWNLEVEYIGTQAACEIFITAAQALQGQVVTIIDDFSVAYINCLVMKVGQAEKKAAIIGGVLGGRIHVRLEGVRK